MDDFITKVAISSMCEKHKENNCFSRVREGPGAQVGATWAPKSRPRGSLGAQNHAQRRSGQPKVASDRTAGGVKRVIWRSCGRLYHKSSNFFNV